MLVHRSIRRFWVNRLLPFRCRFKYFEFRHVSMQVLIRVIAYIGDYEERAWWFIGFYICRESLFMSLNLFRDWLFLWSYRKILFKNKGFDEFLCFFNLCDCFRGDICSIKSRSFESRFWLLSFWVTKLGWFCLYLTSNLFPWFSAYLKPCPSKPLLQWNNKLTLAR